MKQRTTTFVLDIINRGKWLLALISLNLVICSAAYGVLEHKGPIKSLWWAIVTASTVGYGDQYPETTPGRAVAAYLIVSSILLITLGQAYVVARLIKDADKFSDDEQERNEAWKVGAGQYFGFLPAHFAELPPTEWWQSEEFQEILKVSPYRSS